MKRDIFSLANSQVSLFVQALLGVVGREGRVYENIAFTLRLRDAQNKAVRSTEFHVAAWKADVWGSDLQNPNCTRAFKDEKKLGEVYKSIEIAPTIQGREGDYRLSILNGSRDNVLFLLLSPDERRALGRAICRVVSFFEQKKNEQAWKIQ